jgi:hypothetical protein
MSVVLNVVLSAKALSCKSITGFPLVEEDQMTLTTCNFCAVYVTRRREAVFNPYSHRPERVLAHLWVKVS